MDPENIVSSALWYLLDESNPQKRHISVRLLPACCWKCGGLLSYQSMWKEWKEWITAARSDEGEERIGSL
jgi:hypothetical protein